jgi:hypothetical protein
MLEDKAPPISQALLDYLDKTFPDKCPGEEVADRQVWINVGSVRVVRHLRSVHNRQRSAGE